MHTHLGLHALSSLPVQVDEPGGHDHHGGASGNTLGTGELSHLGGHLRRVNMRTAAVAIRH